MPFLELEDYKIHYQIDDYTDAWTKPETILFVHGFTENITAWNAWVPLISRRYRMIRIDQRGFGLSGTVAKDFPLTTELYVDDLVRVINHVAGEPVHIVGGKSGGISVKVLAAQRPDLIKTVTSICSPVTPPNAAGWLEHMDTRGVRSWARATMRKRLGSKMPERGIDWWVDMMGATAASTCHAYMRWVGAIDIREDVKRITRPTLVIGTDTKHRGKSEFESWQKTIPNSEFKVIACDGYHAAGTDPEATAAAVLEFIGRHTG